MANRILAGYVSPNDNGKYEMIVDHDGPTSYVNNGSTYANFVTNGEQINASDFGLGGFEEIGSEMLSSDGQYEILIIPANTTAGALNLQPAPAAPPGPAFVTATLHWFGSLPTRTTEVANGTNLSGRFVRLRIIGV